MGAMKNLLIRSQETPMTSDNFTPDELELLRPTAEADLLKALSNLLDAGLLPAEILMTVILTLAELRPAFAEERDDSLRLMKALKDG